MMVAHDLEQDSLLGKIMQIPKQPKLNLQDIWNVNFKIDFEVDIDDFNVNDFNVNSSTFSFSLQ